MWRAWCRQLSAEGWKGTRQRLAKFTAPLTNSFIGYHYATFKQQLFDSPKAQAEAEVQPHGVADDLYGKPVMLIYRGGG
jgi:hypothetical protein